MPRIVWLYTPGNNISRMQKALSLPLDCVIFDLEDSVPPSEKESARKNIASILESSSDRTVEIGVRINGIGTGFEREDIHHLTSLKPDFFVAPKIESENDLSTVETELAEAESRAFLEPGSVKIFCIIETAKGIVNLKDIVFGSERLGGIMFGAEDFTLDLGIDRSREGKELFYARAKIAVYATAACIEAIDTVFSDIGDREGLIREARDASMMGFSGKTIIHPSQIEPVRMAFSPSPERVDIARKQISAFEKGLQEGLASVSVDGRMVDFPVYERAKKVVALAESLQTRKPEK